MDENVHENLWWAKASVFFGQWHQSRNFQKWMLAFIDALARLEPLMVGVTVLLLLCIVFSHLLQWNSISYGRIVSERE